MPLVIKDKNRFWVAVSQEELGIRLSDTMDTNSLPSNNIVRKIDGTNVMICGQLSLELDILERVLKGKDLKRLNYDMLDKEVYKEVLNYTNRFRRNKDGNRLCFPNLIIANNNIYRMENYGYIFKPKGSCFEGPYNRIQVAESSLEIHKFKNPLEQIKSVYKDIHQFSKTVCGNIYVYNTKTDEILIIEEE